MSLSGIKNIINFMKNHRYKIILSFFAIWLLLIDESSFVNQLKLTKEIESLESTIKNYEAKTTENKELIKVLGNKKGMESFAREQYLMKRKGEDIFVITYDTIK